METIPREITSHIVEKYDVKGPYYTSYPTGKVWSSQFGETELVSSLSRLINTQKGIPLSLYIHFPFCARLCRFCFCYTTVTRDRNKIKRFLATLAKEILLFKNLFAACDHKPDIREIHLGGGTPSYLERGEFEELITAIGHLVAPHELDEFTMEMDAITVTHDKLSLFSENGINRISFGIQDFDPKVQEAIGRVQSAHLIENLLDGKNHRERFKSINFDLMFGLPMQSRSSFRETLDVVTELSPDRAALYNYFHMPQMYTHQGGIKEEHLPGQREKLMIYVDAIHQFTEAGYEFVGIDHFAKPTDDLAMAKRNRCLCRHFMGYTAGRAPHLIGLGPSSLGGYTDYYVQNLYSLDEYQSAVDSNRFPILRGYEMGRDDIIRREVISTILCYFELNFQDIEDKFHIDFDHYFHEEILKLDRFAQDGLLAYTPTGIHIEPLGRIFARQICAVFDAHAESTQDGKTSCYVPEVQRSGTSRNIPQRDTGNCI